MEEVRFIILPILLAAGASTFSSFLWYAFFLKKDSRVIKEEVPFKKSSRTMQDISQISFLAHIFSSSAIYMLIGIFRIETFSQGIIIIAAAFFFLTALSGIKKVVLENKSMENFILGAGHDFVNILVAFSILILLT